MSNTEKVEERKSPAQALGLESRGVLSLVGGGGKTSLMFRLARELAQDGCKVLSTTTTKIFWPTPEQSSVVHVSPDIEEIGAVFRRYGPARRHMTAAALYDEEKDKLVGYNPEDIELIRQTNEFDWLLLEADGARMKPLKAPADHEPVIPFCTTVVVAVVGLTAVGRPLDEEHVFRSQLFSGITGLEIGSPVTEESIAAILMHEKGLFKGAPQSARRIVFLNQADNRELMEKGRRIIGILAEGESNKLDMAILGALKNPKRPLEIHSFRGEG